MVLLFLAPAVSAPQPSSNYLVTYTKEQTIDEKDGATIFSLSPPQQYIAMNCEDPAAAEASLRSQYQETMEFRINVLKIEEYTLSDV